MVTFRNWVAAKEAEVPVFTTGWPRWGPRNRMLFWGER